MVWELRKLRPYIHYRLPRALLLLLPCNDFPTVERDGGKRNRCSSWFIEANLFIIYSTIDGINIDATLSARFYYIYIQIVKKKKERKKERKIMQTEPNDGYLFMRNQSHRREKEKRRNEEDDKCQCIQEQVFIVPSCLLSKCYDIDLSLPPWHFSARGSLKSCYVLVPTRPAFAFPPSPSPVKKQKVSGARPNTPLHNLMGMSKYVISLDIVLLCHRPVRLQADDVHTIIYCRNKKHM